LFAKRVGRGKLVTKINRTDFSDLVNHLDLDSIIYPKNIASDVIVRYIRAMKNTIGSNVETLYNVIPGKVEASEFIVKEGSPIVGKPLSQLEFKKNVLIAAILRDKNILVLSDEIYAELTFGGEKHVSIAEIDGMWERTVVVNGFSKTFSMTGWRLGYACGPAPVMEQITKIHQYAIMCAPTTSQYAAIEALRNGDEAVAAMLEEYDMRRRLIVNGFNKLGLSCREPKGAFYAFPCIRSTGMTSEEFCEKLLYSQKVAIVPGTAFGESGEGFVRASYCYSTEHILEALKRIERFLNTL
jgi:aspartate/methionine/tyrosine aminotransferase